MAGPTKDELVHQIIPRLTALEMEVSRVTAVSEFAHRQYEEALRERLRTDERHEQKLAELAVKQATMEERCRHLERTSDRTWQVWLALISAGVALVVSILKK